MAEEKSPKDQEVRHITEENKYAVRIPVSIEKETLIIIEQTNERTS